MSEIWYPKCIIVYGCEIPNDLVLDFVKLNYPNEYYTHNNQLTDKFYDDISCGIMKNYELRKYKISMSPYKETYYLILNKMVLDICTIENISLILNEPQEIEIETFKLFIKSFNLEYQKFIIIN